MNKFAAGLPDRLDRLATDVVMGYALIVVISILVGFFGFLGFSIVWEAFR